MIGQLPFAEELQNAVGGRLHVHPSDCQDFALYGIVPKLVVSPASVEEAARAAKVIAEEQESLVIRGAGTKSSRPPAPAEVFGVMDMSRCDGILAHEPGDLTVTVAAGTKLAHLQTVLARHGQFLPCDAPFAASATVGGMLAAYSTGALRQRYGTLRDNTLGLRIALSDGSVVFAGAKVVKSVAGYDTHKLFIGSFGTLGAIGEATLKVAPLPQSQALLAARFATSRRAMQAALEIAKSNLFVLATTLHDAASARRVHALPTHDRADWLLLVRCGGNRATLRRQIDGAARFCKIADANDLFEAPEEAVNAVWSEIQELAGGDKYAGGSFVVGKFVALPTDAGFLMDELGRAFPQVELTAHPAFGVVFAHVPASASAFSPAAPSDIGKMLGRLKATAIWLSAPPEFQGLRVPDTLGSARELHARLRAALDPHGVFDPSREPAGV